MHYFVSLFTRPLSWAILFPSVAASSDGTNYLRHWGILISDINLPDLEARAKKFAANDNIVLGTMYELFRQDNQNTVRITTEFGLDSLRKEWPMFSMAYIGRTSMTHEKIKQEGIYFH